MNKFEERIEAAIKRQRHPDQELPEGVHTIGEFISAVFTVENAEDAKEFYDGYLEYLHKQPDLEGEPKRIARSNIGWCFGEGMVLEKIKMWSRTCGASHPVFGTGIPSPKEAFEAGKKMGKGA